MKFEAIRYIERKTGEYKIEKVPGESFLKFLYYNPFGKLALEALVKRKFLSVWYGRKMNSEKSKEKILPCKSIGNSYGRSGEIFGGFYFFQ